MRLWYCEAHGARSAFDSPPHKWCRITEDGVWDFKRCEMVEMHLFSGGVVASWHFCPRCGRPNIDQPRKDGVKQCLPTNCDAWVHESTFNHETRQWDQVGEPG